jgi:hypothetical protein
MTLFVHNHHVRIRLLAAACAAAVASTIGYAQSCQSQWLAGGQQEGIRGVDSTVYAAATYDRDGGGPLPPVLVVGGTFTEAGSLEVRALATWDGANWGSLGDVLNNSSTGRVDAIWVHDGELVIAGNFTSVAGVPARDVAVFDGSSWRALGAGVGSQNFGHVYALTTYNGNLIAAGSFATAGTAVATNIARWDGSAWHPVGTGKVRDDGGQTLVKALTVYNNELIAGGNFKFAGELQTNAIARWNGNVWQPLGAGLTDSSENPGTVESLAVFNGALMAGGSFSTAGSTPVSDLARWNGTAWSNPTPGSSYGSINSMHVAQGFLYLDDAFSGAARRWNGSSTTAEQFGGNFSGTANTITSFGPEVVHAGSISRVGASPDNTEVRNIVAWDGTEWIVYGQGINSTVNSLLRDGTGMYFGGSFTTAGNIDTDRIVRWDGNSTWTRLGDGLNSTVQDMALYNGQLVVAGGFSSSGSGQQLGQVARWTGSVWQPVAPANIVNSANRLFVNGGDLIVSNVSSVTGPGGFTSQPHGEVVAIYNGSTWQRLGTGFNGTVYEVIVWNGQIVATGSFTSVSNQTGRNYIAIWNGSSWQPLGSGLNSTGETLAIYNGDLIVGGSFTVAGGTNGINYIARWNGTTWQGIGSGLNSPVNDLEVIGGELFATGSFSTAGGNTANRIARWNGVTWSSFDSGLNTTGEDIEQMSDGRVIVGGSFTQAGGANSYYWAQLAPGGTAFQIVNQPTDSASCPASTVQFVVDVSSSSGVTYQWRRNGETLRNGRGISGVNTNSLAIANLTTDDNGLYDCILTSVCGRSATRAAVLSVEPLPECPVFCDDIDFNNDGSFFDPCDINSFLLVFSEGPCTNCGE